MDSDLIIKKKNEVYLQIHTHPHIAYELTDHFTFEVPEAKFMPAYRQRHWDGKIRLFSPGTGELYCGLKDYVIQFCKERGYVYNFADNEYYGLANAEDELVSFDGVKSFVKRFTTLKARDYQYTAIYEALRKKRKLIVSPTGSGKSFMIYSIVRFLQETGQKIMIVVPTTSLVEQMYKDFKEYGWDSEQYCHKVYAGHEKVSPKPVTITTWQSVYKQKKSFFQEFTAVIGDEAHLFKAQTLKGILEKMKTTAIRIGTTGTLDGSEVHRLQLEGLFGPVKKVITTKDLMDEGTIANLSIECVILRHTKQKKMSYQDEMDYLVGNDSRNEFICNLVYSLKGNTLVLFQYVEKHGAVLHGKMFKRLEDKLHYVYGGTDVTDREEVRELVEKSNDNVILASYGTFSTGVNIKKIDNVVFASPSKSRIRNLQSIGRGLRKADGKTEMRLFDISDDLQCENHTLNHLKERINIYNEEGFVYQMRQFNIT